MYRTIFVLLIVLLALEFSYGNDASVQSQFNQRLRNLENCRKINSCTVRDTVFSTDKETFQELINLSRYGKLNTLPEDRVLCSTKTYPQKINPVNQKKMQEGKIDQELLTADHSKSLKFYDKPQDSKAQVDISRPKYIKSYTFGKGAQRFYGNCLITLRYREQTEIKSILLNGQQMSMVTKIGMGNKTLTNFEVANSFLILVEKLGSTTVIYELRVNSLTCKISNQIVTYSKTSDYSDIEFFNNQLIGFYGHNSEFSDTSYLVTYKSSKGVVTKLEPQFVQTISIFGFGSFYGQIWKIRYSNGQAHILGALVNSDQYINIFNGGIKPGIIYVWLEIAYQAQNCPISSYREQYYYGIKMRMESITQTISKTLRVPYDPIITYQYFTNAGQLIRLTQSTYYDYWDQREVTSRYLSVYNSINFQQIYFQRLYDSFPYILNQKSGSFIVFKFQNSTNYAFDTTTATFYPLPNNLQIIGLYSIFDSTYFVLFTRTSVRVLHFLNRQFIQKASHTITTNGSIDPQSIYVDSSTYSLVFDFLNFDSQIPSIMREGMYYLFLNKTCITTVPTSKCSINSISTPFAAVYKHWDENKGDFWTAPSEQLDLFKIVKKSNKRYIYSVSDSQAQSRNFDQYIQKRTLRNPPKSTSRLGL